MIDPNAEEGYIYCISNLDIMPDIYKVGVTMRDPNERLKEANSSDTWKIPSYKIEFAKKVYNPKEKEITLHKLMEKFMNRVHPRREFFKGNIEDIKQSFKLMDGLMWTNNNEISNKKETINTEDLLSNDPDIRVRQIIDIIHQEYTNDKVEINLISNEYFAIIINDKCILLLENNNVGRSKIGSFKTIVQNFKNKEDYRFLLPIYKELNWDSVSGKNFVSQRRYYDTEGKSKRDICNIFQIFKKYISNSPEGKSILWSDEQGEIIDKYGDRYSFDKQWRNNNYVKTILKNGKKYPDKGVQRGYKMWLDQDNIIRLAHGHLNMVDIEICILVKENQKDKGWQCNWGKCSAEERKSIYDHFDISL